MKERLLDHLALALYVIMPNMFGEPFSDWGGC